MGKKPILNKRPLVSIITVCFNSEAFIRETIESVLFQTYRNFEYIIIDGNSTDHTAQIIREYEKKFPERMKLYVEENLSAVECWNRGIGISRGEIIGFLNSDDFYVTNRAVEKIARIFSVREDVDSCYFDILLVDRMNIQKKKRLWVEPPNAFLSDFKFGWSPAHPSFYTSRRTYMKYGYYNPAFSIAADFDLMCRFIKIKKVKIVYLPEILVKMRVGGMSNKNIVSIIKGNWECFIALKKNGIFPYCIFFKPLRKLIQIIRVKIQKKSLLS